MSINDADQKESPPLGREDRSSHRRTIGAKLRHVSAFVGLGSFGVLTQLILSLLDPKFYHYLVADTVGKQDWADTGRAFTFPGTEAVGEIVKYRSRYPLISDDALIQRMSGTFPAQVVGGGGSSRSVVTIRLAPGEFELRSRIQSLVTGMLARLGDDVEGNGLSFHLALAAGGSTGGAIVSPVAALIRSETNRLAPNVRQRIVTHIVASEVHENLATTARQRDRIRANGTSLLAEMARFQDPSTVRRYYDRGLRIDPISVPLFDAIKYHGATTASGRSLNCNEIGEGIVREFLAEANSEALMAAESARDVDAKIAGRPEDRPELCVLETSSTTTIGIPVEMERVYEARAVDEQLEALLQSPDQEKVERLSKAYEAAFKVDASVASIDKAHYSALGDFRKRYPQPLHEIERNKAVGVAAERHERFQTGFLSRTEALGMTIAQRHNQAIPKVVEQGLSILARASASLPEVAKVTESLLREVDERLAENRRKREALPLAKTSAELSEAMTTAGRGWLWSKVNLVELAKAQDVFEDCETMGRILDSRIASLECFKRELGRAQSTQRIQIDLLAKESIENKKSLESNQRQLLKTSPQNRSIIHESEYEAVFEGITRDVADFRGKKSNLTVEQVMACGSGPAELASLVGRFRTELATEYQLAIERTGDLEAFREKYRLRWDLARSLAEVNQQLATSTHVNSLQIGMAQVPEQTLFVAGGSIYDKVREHVDSDPTMKGKVQIVRDDANAHLVVARRRRLGLPLYSIPNLEAAGAALERWQEEHAHLDPSPATVLWSSADHMPANLDALKPKPVRKSQPAPPLKSTRAHAATDAYEGRSYRTAENGHPSDAWVD
jgi:hypothetical protein